jgi:hypothetical protein
MKTILALFLVFFLGHLIPNTALHSFIFHEVDFWTYSMPLFGVGLICASVLLFRVASIRDIALWSLAASSGIFFAYCIEVLTFPLRVLNGIWPEDFWLGVAFHGYIFRETLWRELLPFVFILILGFLFSISRSKAEQDAPSNGG